jgi:deoxycytidylate deaminase
MQRIGVLSVSVHAMTMHDMGVCSGAFAAWACTAWEVYGADVPVMACIKHNVSSVIKKIIFEAHYREKKIKIS